MAYIVHKIVYGETEFLPDIVDTPIWDDYDEIDAPKSVRIIAALYKAIADRENYYQENSPTAFGNPDYSRICGIVIGILQATEIEEQRKDDKLIFYKGKRKVLVVDKLKLPRHYYEARRDIAKTRRALGL